MILESMVTTCDEAGRVNIAPMGPHVDGPDLRDFVLYPFRSSTTCNNLLATRRATVHVTDDVALFARAAVGRVDADGLVLPVSTENDLRHWRLKDCHRWFALEITDIAEQLPRYRMACRVVDSGTVRPFFGFNRAKHAIIEACILATRLHLIEAAEVLREFDRLKIPVEKTASDDDRETFDWLESRVRAKLSE